MTRKPQNKDRKLEKILKELNLDLTIKNRYLEQNIY